MSTKENLLNRDIQNLKDEKDKQKDDELIKFTKYTKLAREMHQHILTYCSDSSRYNYSQCSKSCNLEIQLFNTVPPQMIRLTEVRSGIEVELLYSNKRRAGVKTVEHKFDFPRYQEYQVKGYLNIDKTMAEIQKYLMKYYKHVGQKFTTSIFVDVEQWPTKLMKWKHITNIEKWEVVMYTTMYMDFMAYFRTTNARVNHLALRESFYEEFTLGPDFFKSDLFKRTPNVHIDVICEIDNNDFLNLRKPYCSLKHYINNYDILAKVRKLNRSVNLEECYIRIESPYEDDDIFEILDFLQHYYEDGDEDSEDDEDGDGYDDNDEGDDGYEFDDDDDAQLHIKIGKVHISTDSNEKALILYVAKD